MENIMLDKLKIIKQTEAENLIQSTINFKEYGLAQSQYLEDINIKMEYK
jgi:hypothetical protein